jgi:EF hand
VLVPLLPTCLWPVDQLQPHTDAHPPIGIPGGRAWLLPLLLPQAFELTLDIDRLIHEVDVDRSGFIDFAEFKAILS